MERKQQLLFFIQLILIYVFSFSCGPGLKINEKLALGPSAERIIRLSFDEGDIKVMAKGVEQTSEAYLRTSIAASADTKNLFSKDIIETDLQINRREEDTIWVGPKIRMGLSTETVYGLLLRDAAAQSLTPFTIIVDGSNIELFIRDNMITETKIKDGAVTANKLHSMGAEDGDILKYDTTLNSGAGGWYTAPEAGGGGGGVSSITTGTGLVGGTITTSGVISVDVGSTAGKILQLDATGDLTLGRKIIFPYAGPQNFSLFNDSTFKIYDETNAASRFEINAAGDVVIAGGLTVSGEGVCLADGTDCPPSGAGGTVTSVASGTGLTGGPITTTGTLSIANGGVDTTQLANGAVTAAKLNQMAANAGQVMKWNGTGWEASTDNNSGGTLTNVATGTGLTGGPITTTGTVSIANGGVDTTQLANAGVTMAKIENVLAGRFIVGDATNRPAIVVMSGDGSLSSAGALTIANDAIDLNKMANITQGSIIVGGAASAPTYLDANDAGKILIGDGTDLVSINVTGDAALASTGILTINNGAITAAKLNQMGAGTGQVIKWNGATWIATDDSNAGGTVSNIATGSGLTGGPISTTGTISVSSGGITSTHLSDGTIINADISADAAIDVTKLGTGVLTVQNGGTSALLRLRSNSGQFVDISPLDALVAGYSLTLPPNDGGAGQFLQTNGSGVLTWSDATASNIGTSQITDEAITMSKIEDMTAGRMIVGDATNRPAIVAMSGDATLSATGALTINDTAITAAKLNQMGAGTGQVMKWNGSTWVATDDNNAGGTVTNIATGSGLTGGPISTTGTISVNSGGITSTHLSDGTIINADISADAAIDMTKLGTGVLTVQNGGTSALLRLRSNSGQFVDISPLDALVAGYSLTLPPNDGGPSQFLQTNGSGTLIWADPAIATSMVADEAITMSKIEDMTAGRMIVGDATNRPAIVAMSGDATLSATGALTITDDAVSLSKMANIAQGSIIVGGAANAPTYLDANDSGKLLIGDGTDLASVAFSGDGSLTSAGVFAIGTGVITNSDISDSAAIDATKIGGGSVSNTEFSYLDGVSSAIQTQIDTVNTTLGYVATYNVTRQVGNAIGDTIEIGTFSGAVDVNVQINWSYSQASHSASKIYYLLNDFDANPGTWVELLPLHESHYYGGDNEADIDAYYNQGANTVTLRLRNTSGYVYTAGTRITLQVLAPSTGVTFTPSSGTASGVSVPTLYQKSTVLSQKGRKVAIAKKNPSYELDVSGDIYASGAIKVANSSGNTITLDASNASFADKTYYLPTADGSADDVLKTNGSGNLSFAKSLKTYRIIRTTPSNVSDTVMLGSFTGGANHFFIEIYMTGSGSYWGNHYHYILPWTYDRLATDTWFEVVPVNKEYIPFAWTPPTNDVALDARFTSGGNLEFRMRRIAKDGSAGGNINFNIEIIDHTMASLAFVESTTTAAGVATPTLYYGTKGIFSEPAGTGDNADARSSEVVVKGLHPQILFEDTDAPSNILLHANSKKLYIIPDDGAGAWGPPPTLLADTLNSRVGVNMDNPTTALDVNGKGRFSGIDGANLQVNGTNNSTIDFTVSDGLRADMGVVNNETHFYIRNLNTGHIILRTNANSVGSYIANWDGNLYNVSDRRYKENIKELNQEESLANILKLKPSLYHFKLPKSSGRISYGLIAQEVKEVYPDMVGKDEKGYLSLGYNSLVAPIIASIQALYQKIINLITDVDDIKEENSLLKSKIEALTKIICQDKPHEEICQQ